MCVCRWKAIPMSLSELSVALRSFRRADSSCPQAHGCQAVPLSPLFTLVRTFRPSRTAHEETRTNPVSVEHHALCWRSTSATSTDAHQRQRLVMTDGGFKGNLTCFIARYIHSRVGVNRKQPPNYRIRLIDRWLQPRALLVNLTHSSRCIADCSERLQLTEYSS